MQHEGLKAVKRKRARKFMERKHKKRVAWTGTNTVASPKVPHEAIILEEDQATTVLEEVFRRTLFQHQVNHNQWRLCLRCWLFFRVYVRKKGQYPSPDTNSISAHELKVAYEVSSPTTLLKFIKEQRPQNTIASETVKLPGIRHKGLSPMCEYCADFSLKKKKEEPN